MKNVKNDKAADVLLISKENYWLIKWNKPAPVRINIDIDRYVLYRYWHACWFIVEKNYGCNGYDKHSPRTNIDWYVSVKK